ncbi:glycosyltransferase family 4 protein [Arcobacter arenosus]|uniref:Glycosyltransferase family 4 protein n=1 Tax=Arcobacter arenosus TaxID=2576037 RepID=A0A5R8Y111_9BACT|nr:glycosyltransferase family 4 protein [Arcobacter arenosus]TLP37773.1 glycosyltransferase family 4 protein [Arcobacter arenosus]
MDKLLHISANIYQPLNGKHHHTKNIWKELAKGFDEYHVLARNKTNSYSYSNEGNIHLHLLPRITKKSKIFFITSFWMFWIIKKYKITHLLAQCPIVGGFMGVIASKIFKIPLFVEIHGDIYFKYMQEKTLVHKIFSKITKVTFNNATKIRSLSIAMNDMLNRYGISENIKVVPNRVNLELFKSQKRSYELHSPIRIISIGRFVQQKGYDIAIEAIKKLSYRHYIELYLIGGGNLYDKYVDLSKGYENIKLIKWIEQSELKVLLEESDIYIQPSKPYFGEAMPRTILEAMAMKLPIIATNIAAIPGILNNTNAIVINPNKVDELVEAIETLINNINLRERLALQGYQDIISKYEWNKVFELYRNELKSMKYENT